jgi:hypothetical protein
MQHPVGAALAKAHPLSLFCRLAQRHAARDSISLNAWPH